MFVVCVLFFFFLCFSFFACVRWLRGYGFRKYISDTTEYAHVQFIQRRSFSYQRSEEYMCDKDAILSRMVFKLYKQDANSSRKKTIFGISNKN